MRLDIVITELDVGGAETFCVELAKYLNSRGHRVRVIAIGPKPPSDRDRLLRELQAASVECVFLGCSSMFGFLGAARQMRRLIDSDPPDLVQSLLWHANVVTAYALRSTSIPLIGGVRVSDPRRWRFLISRWAARRMKSIVCVSRSTRDWCEKIERLPAEKLLVIPNGVDIEAMQRRALESPDHPILKQGLDYLLFVGRLHTQKGIDILIASGERLLRALPDMHLVFVGDGSWRSWLEEFKSESSFGERIHVVGQSDQVPSWIGGCRLLVLPTRYEGMPNVILEAMSLAKPVATMSVEGVEEVLGKQCREQSVPAGDWYGWRRLIVGLAKDPAKLKQLGDENRIRVQREFDLQTQLSKYEELYHRSISEKLDP